jgi:hypothetical protein
MITAEEIIKNLLTSTATAIVNKTIESTPYKNKQFTMHPKEFEMFDMNKIPIPEDDLSISYHYNSDGFRCEDLSLDEDFVLFSGCSEGEGIGANLDTTWTKIVFNEIKDLLNVNRFYNLSVDNFGYQKIISNSLSFLTKTHKPSAVIILFPEISRTVSWDKIKPEYTVEWTNINHISNNSDFKHIMDSFVNFIGLMHVFEAYCDSNDIKLFWSTWSQTENNVIRDINVFKNFVPFDYSIYKNTDLERKQTRRDGHQGEYHHRLWATNIQKSIRESGFFGV